MVEKIAIIGGDLRIVKLAEMLVEEGYKIYTYGLEKTEKLESVKCSSVKEAVDNGDIVIGPVPLSSNNEVVNSPFSDEKISIDELMNSLDGKMFIAGSIKQEIYNMAHGRDINIIDMLKREELSILNAISTAEGAIQIAIEETSKTLHGSNILILGFGRIGKILSKMLDGMGAKVYCEARKSSDLAWAKAYGYTQVHLNELDENLDKADIIINTIPFIVLNDDNLDNVKRDCLIIDLASNPGGVDKEAIKRRKLKFVWALSLPGKVAPITSAEFMKETLYNILKEVN